MVVDPVAPTTAKTVDKFDTEIDITYDKDMSKIVIAINDARFSVSELSEIIFVSDNRQG